MQFVDIEQPKRIAPRQFRQYATVILEKGDQIVRCHDHTPSRVGVCESGRYTAQRACRRDGEPTGPWTFIVSNYHFRPTDDYPQP